MDRECSTAPVLHLVIFADEPTQTALGLEQLVCRCDPHARQTGLAQGTRDGAALHLELARNGAPSSRC